MKALRIPGTGRIETVDVPEIEPAEGEILLEIKYVGFCGSDLNTFRGGNLMAKPDVIPGHEIGATIAKLGPGVPDKFTVGMSVTVNPYSNCGICPSCRNGRPNACKDNQTLGVQRDGAMREFFSVPWTKVIPAGHLSLKECALVEPMSVGFHSVSRAAVTDSDTVMVIGCGMVGLGAIVRASLRGAKVIAVDVDDCKLELAKEIGATLALNSMDEHFHDSLMKVTDGFGPDVVIEAVGSPVTYRMAVDEVAFTGRVICIGYSKSDVTFQTRLFVQKELDIRGSRNAMPMDFEAVIRYLEKGTCPVEKLVTRIIRPEESLETMGYWQANPGKVFRILVDFQ